MFFAENIFVFGEKSLERVPPEIFYNTPPPAAGRICDRILLRPSAILRHIFVSQEISCERNKEGGCCKQHPPVQGYKDSNLEMTESESVALPFGDSPS